MQGFISGITSLKNEDLIVHIITKNQFMRLYRFYGSRHSIINIGRKIDFDVEYCGQFMPKLRNIAHLNLPWENDYKRFYYWQRFLKLLNNHLNETLDLPNFYFNMLNNSVLIFSKQDPKRVLIDMYIMLLGFEGRLNISPRCFICDDLLDENIVITRGFLCSHVSCVPSYSQALNKDKFFKCLNFNKSILMSDSEIDYLLSVLMLGI